MQYNSDDPAALVHYALEKMATYTDYWHQLIHHLNPQAADSMDVGTTAHTNTTAAQGKPIGVVGSQLGAPIDIHIASSRPRKSHCAVHNPTHVPAS